MSRVSLIEQLYVKRKSALEFNYDALWAPPIRSILLQEDINELYRIATSLRYNANIERKYELIDSIMTARGFKRAHCGTNRVVYNFLENPTFVAKVAVDKVGIADSPAEYRNQEYFKPFCCKIFEVDPSGVIAFVERVNPITSLEEFLSVSDDVFNMMLTKIVGKYVVDDLGNEKYMNYGLRYNANGTTFGPVIIDFPYAYELDGGKLICNKLIETPLGCIPCGGEIDYDTGFNHLVCTKCGKTYKAMDLKKNDNSMIIMYGDDNSGGLYQMRVKIIADGKVIKDSGYSSETHITKEQFENLSKWRDDDDHSPRKVTKNKHVKYKNSKEYRQEYYSALQAEQYAKINHESFNTIGGSETTVATTKTTSRVADTEEIQPIILTSNDTGYITKKVKSKKAIEYSGNISRIIDIQPVTIPEENYTENIDSDETVSNTNAIDEKAVDITDADTSSLVEDTDSDDTVSDNNVIDVTDINDQSIEDISTDADNISNASSTESMDKLNDSSIESENIPNTILEDSKQKDTRYFKSKYKYDDMSDMDPYSDYKPSNRSKKQKKFKGKKNKYNPNNDPDMSEY